MVAPRARRRGCHWNGRAIRWRRELMLVGERWRDADILASLQTPFTVNQVVYSIDDQLHQLHLDDTDP